MALEAAAIETAVVADEDRLWQAFVVRDRSLDGAVFCGVRSTGIYCRTTCPARRPHRSQVLFFLSTLDAKEAGFRACFRCHPDRRETDADLVRGACTFIDEFLQTHGALPTVQDVGRAVGLTLARLQRLFKLEMGLTVSQYMRGRRMEKFKGLVREGGSVTEAIYDAGFSSSSRLYESAKEQMGMTPASYRKGGAGAEIGYIFTQSALGGLLVAGTGSGICAVKLGDDAAELIAELAQEFPAASVRKVEPQEVTPVFRNLHSWTESLLGYLGGLQVDIDLPLDVVATAFQWRVWRRLQGIPAGETRTYQEMAGDLGQPTASRAVGRACATNPVAPIVPCHRAVRKDGGLAGYRWGLHRKEALLRMEQRQSEG